MIVVVFHTNRPLDAYQESVLVAVIADYTERLLSAVAMTAVAPAMLASFSTSEAVGSAMGPQPAPVAWAALVERLSGMTGAAASVDLANTVPRDEDDSEGDEHDQEEEEEEEDDDDGAVEDEEDVEEVVGLEGARAIRQASSARATSRVRRRHFPRRS
jgi:hypothetical protein